MPSPDLKNAGRIIRLWALMRIVLAFLFFAIVRLDQSMIAIMLLLGLACIALYRHWRLPKLVHLAGFRGIQFLIDPLADRVFLIAAVASLVSLPESVLPIWPAYAVAFRDVFLAFFFLGALFRYSATNFESLPQSGYDCFITVVQYGILALAVLNVNPLFLYIAASLLFLLSIRSCVSMIRTVREVKT